MTAADIIVAALAGLIGGALLLYVSWSIFGRNR